MTNKPTLRQLNHITLRDEVGDMRHLIFDAMDLQQRLGRGTILVARGHGLERGVFDEYSTNLWKNVRDACRDLQLLERTSSRNQIRVVKHDEIIQSSIEPWGFTGNGLTPEFLRTPLEAGDVVIIATVAY